MRKINRVRTRGRLPVFLLLIFTATATILFAQGYATKIYMKQGGAEQVVKSGGKITIESGGIQDFENGAYLKIGGVQVTPSAAELNVLDGVTAGTTVASKAVVVDGNRYVTYLGITDARLTDVTISDTMSVTGNAVLNATSFNDKNITNVGDIALDSITADDGSSFSMGSNWTNAGRTVADLGIVTTVDINGGSIDGVTIGAAAAPTVTNLGSVTTCDINGGTVDGVEIGGAAPAAGTFTILTAPDARLTDVTVADTMSVADTAALNGGMTVGASGTKITQIVFYAQATDFTTVDTETVADQTVTVTGVTTSDVITINPAADLEAGLLILQAYVSAENTVTVRLYNTTGAAIDPAQVTLNIVAIRKE